MCVMIEESFMVYLKCRYMCNIEFNVTQKKSKNGKSKYQCSWRKYSIPWLDIFLYRTNASVTKKCNQRKHGYHNECFKNKKTFTTHSKQSAKNILQLLKIKKY